MGIIISNGDRLVIRPSELTPEQKAAKQLIVIDPEKAARNTVVDTLCSDGYVHVHPAATIPELEGILERSVPDLVLLNLNLGTGPEDAIQLIQQFDDHYKVPTHFVVIRGNDSEREAMERAVRTSAIDYLVKPIDPLDLRLKIEKALIDIGIRHGASTDGLTQIPNKTVFNQVLHQQIKDFERHYQRYRETPGQAHNAWDLSVALFDLDNFKRYNDENGHIEGDYVLKKAAAYFRSQLRTNDLFARWGGEEFVIIMPETPFNDAFSVYSRVAWDFSEQLFKPKEGKTERITCSAGIATLTFDLYASQLAAGLDPRSSNGIVGLAQHMLTSADQGLYRVKKAGKAKCYPKNTLDDSEIQSSLK